MTARVGVGSGERLRLGSLAGPEGRFVGMKTFGASAPGSAAMKYFGFTVEHVVAEAKAALG